MTPVGEWARQAGISTVRLNQEEMAELDRLVQLKGQATDFSKAQQTRYDELLKKARGE